VEVERYKGIIIRVGTSMVKSPPLPDWMLSYIEYPPGKMVEYREALQKQHVKIRKVTKERIYFED
jgi:hypothetical protein